jgi:hypothetical protein
VPRCPPHPRAWLHWFQSFQGVSLISGPGCKEPYLSFLASQSRALENF